MIRGAKGSSKGSGGGDEAHTPVEAPDTLHSIAMARIIDLIGEGECEGFPSGLQNICLDETPIQNEDGSFNFKNVFVDTRLGTQDQEPLADFPEVESETAVGVLLETDTPWTHNFTNTALTGVRVRVAVSALMAVDPETGDTNGYSVEYAIDLSVDGGGYIQMVLDAFTGKASSPFERSHVILLPPATTSWQVRVRRITPEGDTSYIQDQTSVVSFTELIQANLRMPNSMVVGLRIDASQFRSIPTRAYRPKGRIIRVPTNYDPITLEYDGVWDGTFKSAWSRNPAWIYYDMATNYRFGLGRFLPDVRVDKWALYQIAQYCDELVDDGLGGEEPRFQCDIYLQKAADAYKVMQDLASVFRGISYWAAGKVMAVCDKPRDPVYTFTNANVIDGRFTYQGTSRQARHTVAMVHWGDPNDFGRGKIEYVPDDEAIARYGIQILTMTAIGATSQGQAHRCGRWALLTEQMETNTVTFDVGLDGCIPQPGQVVRIADKMRSGPRIGGRVRAATSSVITPDAMPTASIGDLLTVVLPTAVTQTRPVSAVGVDTISVSPAFDTAPVAHAAWVIESPELVAGLFNVVGVAENAGLQYTVMAMQHAPEKFAAADFGIVIQPQNTSQIPPKTIAPPESVTISSHIVSDPVPRRVVVIEWPAVVGASRYEVSWQRNMSDWSSPVSVNTRRYEIDNALPGDYKARVKAVTSTGLASLDRISDTVVIPVIVMPEILLSDTSSDILYDETESYILYSEPA